MIRKAHLLPIILCCFFALLLTTGISSNFSPRRDNSALISTHSLKSADIAYDPNHLSNYTLNVVINETEGSLEGLLLIDYYNDDPLTFDRLPLHIYLSGMEHISRQGYTQIHDIYLADSPFTTLTYEIYEDVQLMWVNLTEGLLPENRVRFYIEFESLLPDGGIDRANVNGTDLNEDRILKFAHFYPVPCVYDEEDGWNTDPYLNYSDPFYYDMAFYDLYIEAPSALIIAATGELKDKTTINPTSTHHYHANLPVREVTFSVSRYFTMETTMHHGINVTTYFLPQSYTNWHTNALNYTKQALDFYNSSIGEYPYSTFNVVQEHTQHGGMEYPCQFYAAVALDNYAYPLVVLERVIVHETGHQWFYNLIGFDEVDEGFFDEGLTSWITEYLYIDKYHPTWENFVQTPLNKQVRYYADLYGKRPAIVNQSVYECWQSNTNFWYVGYTKCPAILEKLRIELSNDTFMAGLRLFFNRFQFKIATFEGFQEIMEEVSGKLLDWFFQPWFNNPQIPWYALNLAVYNQDSDILSLDISDKNGISHIYPYSQRLPLKVYDRMDNVIYTEEIWINGTTRAIEISLDSRPGSVEISLLGDVISEMHQGEPQYLQLDVQRSWNIPGYQFPSLMVCAIVTIIIKLRKSRS